MVSCACACNWPLPACEFRLTRNDLGLGVGRQSLPYGSELASAPVASERAATSLLKLLKHEISATNSQPPAKAAKALNSSLSSP